MSGAAEDHGKQIGREQLYRKCKTILLLVIYVGFGMCASIEGPSVPDLAARMCVSLSQISVAFSMGGVGSILGSFTFGFLHDRFQTHCDLLLATTLTIIGVSVIMKPHVPIGWFIVSGVLESVGYAGTDGGSNSMMFGLWGEKANGPMHALHLGFGVGATIGPLIVRPFLGSDKNDTNISGENDTCIDDSEIQNPYLIASSMMFALAAIAIAFYVTGPPKGMVIHSRPIKSVSQVFDATAIGGGDPRFGIGMLVLFALFYFGNAGREHVFSTWLFTYAIESDLDFSKQEAALLDAANKASFMIGRLISTPISHFAPIQPMLFVEIYTVMVLVTGLATFGTSHKLYLWVFSCSMSVVAAPIWPGCITWMNRYVPVTAIFFPVMTIGVSSAGLFFQWLTGWLFTNRSADDVMYVLISNSVLLCVLMVVMQVAASRKGNRFDRARDKREEKQEAQEDKAAMNLCFISETTQL